MKAGNTVKYSDGLDEFTYTVLEVNPPNAGDSDLRVRVLIELKEWDGCFKPTSIVHESDLVLV